MSVSDLSITYKADFNVQQEKPYTRITRKDENTDETEIIYCMPSHFQSGKAPHPPGYQVFLTEIINPRDPRAQLFDEAKKREIQGVIEKGTWKIILKSEMSDNPNILEGRFVFTIKDAETDRERWKARFRVQKH